MPSDQLLSEPGAGPKAAFLANVETSFVSELDIETLYDQSCRLTESLRYNLSDAQSLSMLPSFIDAVPSGNREGWALAVDIGGSTMRVAVVRLDPSAEERSRRLRVEQQHQWRIDSSVRELRGEQFFDWLANNVKTFFTEISQVPDIRLEEIPMGLVWSFPLEQTELNDGELRDMGKGFMVGHDLWGKSLNSCISTAFARIDLPLRLEAIVNDSISVVLALQYLEPQTQFGIVAGTGFNGTLSLPASCLAPSKYGCRSQAWIDSKQDILVDAELCVTGQEIFPKTKWDSNVSLLLPRPEIIGLEQFVGGFLMAEIIRQILVEAASSVGLFNGTVPPRIRESFSLGLETAAMFDTQFPVPDDVKTRGAAAIGLETQELSDEDAEFVRRVCRAVTTRASAYLAAALHSMRMLQDSIHEKLGRTLTDTRANGQNPARQLVSCVGSVLEKYPNFMSNSQNFLDRLHDRCFPQVNSKARLQYYITADSSLTGVSVAAVMGHAMLHSDLHAAETAVPSAATSQMNQTTGSAPDDNHESGAVSDIDAKKESFNLSSDASHKSREAQPSGKMLRRWIVCLQSIKRRLGFESSK